MNVCHTLRRHASAFLAVVSLVLGLMAANNAFAQAIQLPPGKSCFQANAGLTGMIGSLGSITGGAGGTNGTYGGVPVTGGSGSGATANVTVAGNTVTAFVILNPGIGYIVGDVLSAASANIGNVTGFSVTVASTAINSSLAGGTVGMFTPGTLSPAQTWQNSAETILNTNPVSLDLNGCAVIFGAGSYRQILYDNLGNLIWDQVVSVLPPLFAGTATGTGNAQTLASVSTYTNGLTIVWTAAATNTAAAVLNSYPIYEAGPTGPATLTGGEISAGSTYVSTWVQALNSGAGGWQLATSFLSPTQAPGANTTQNATTAFVTAAIAAQAVSAPTPQTTVLTTGAGTYTTPTVNGVLPLYLEEEMCGGGSGGGGSGSGAAVGVAGGATTFGTLLSAGGGPATPTNTSTSFPTPAAATGGDINIPGALGAPPSALNELSADGAGQVAYGASAPFGLGQGGTPGTFLTGPATAPASSGTGFCAGGGAAGILATSTTYNSGWGGNAGAGLKKTITAPAASYPYAVGTGGPGGLAGTNGNTGAAGAGGVIEIIARWQ